MEKSSSEESAIHRSPSLDSHDSEFARASAATGGRRFGGRGFTAGAFYGSTGPRAGAAAAAANSGASAQAPCEGANPCIAATGTNITGDKSAENKYKAPKGSKYVVFYLDLSFVFLLEFKKCNMARGCLCCLKYMMFLFNLIFWVSGSFHSLHLSPAGVWCLPFLPPLSARGC